MEKLLIHNEIQSRQELILSTWVVAGRQMTFLSGEACGATGVKAFTIGFDDDRFDESSIAREMAEQTGADFLPYPFVRSSPIGSIIGKNILLSLHRPRKGRKLR